MATRFTTGTQPTQCFALLLALALAHAVPSPARSTPCLTLDQAAQAALAVAIPLSDEFEYGGALIVRDGCHTFTEPSTSGQIGDIALQIRFASSYTLAGIYHTHPANSDLDHVFSPHDVRTQRTLGVPSYIGVVGTGAVKALRGEERHIGKRARRIETAAGEELTVTRIAANK